MGSVDIGVEELGLVSRNSCNHVCIQHCYY